MSKVKFVIGCFILLISVPVHSLDRQNIIQEVSKLLNTFKARCLSQYNLLDEGSCERDFDRFWGCWGSTPRNTTATMPCSSYFFYTDAFVTRKCNETGGWEDVNQRDCVFLSYADSKKRRAILLLNETTITSEDLEEQEDDTKFRKLIRTILVSARYVDISVCFISLVFIFALIPLKNNRFLLHRFLVLGFFLLDAVHIALIHSTDYTKATCSVLDLFAHYFFLVTVFMMFCEGFYQFRQFYFVFVTNHRVWTYVIFAYVFPAVITWGIYTPVMIFKSPRGKSQEICFSQSEGNPYIYIIVVPVMFLLLVNMMITVYLMRLIVSKLKTEKSSDLIKVKKTTRSLLVLLILLGLGYAITIFGPDEQRWWRVTRAIIQPTQGILICITQVFNSHHLTNALKLKLKKIDSKNQMNNMTQVQSANFSIAPEKYDASERASNTSNLGAFGLLKGNKKNVQEEKQECEPKKDFKFAA